MNDKKVEDRYSIVELAKDKLNQEYIDKGLMLLMAKDKVETVITSEGHKIRLTLQYEKE